MADGDDSLFGASGGGKSDGSKSKDEGALDGGFLMESEAEREDRQKEWSDLVNSNIEKDLSKRQSDLESSEIAGKKAAGIIVTPDANKPEWVKAEKQGEIERKRLEASGKTADKEQNQAGKEADQEQNKAAKTWKDMVREAKQSKSKPMTRGLER